MKFKSRTLYGYTLPCLSDCSLSFVQRNCKSYTDLRWLMNDQSPDSTECHYSKWCVFRNVTLGNGYSYFIEWEVLVFCGKCHHILQWSYFPTWQKIKHLCVRLTNSLKSVLRFLPSSRRRPAILFLILSDVQIIRPLIMARMYSVITRRWTSPTRTCNDNVNETEFN